MLKKHIILFQTKENGWIAYSTSFAEANRMLAANVNHDVFYIFECDILIQHPYTLKLKFPFYKYYNCKKIINIKKKNFRKTKIT